jgi:hypothetical protein
MTTPYDFAHWQQLTRRRDRVMDAFDLFRQSFLAELQQFIETAAAAGIYGVSPLQAVEGYNGLFRFSFGPFKFIVVSNNSVLEAFEGADLLRARIALYYHTHDVNQPPVFIVEFGEAAEGMVCDIGRTATGEWHDVSAFPVTSPANDGTRAARAVGQVIAATPAAWRRNLPWPLLAEEQQEIIELVNPLGFQPNQDR